MENDKTDMGPFKGMDAAVVRAITSYGTPPYRDTVTVDVRRVGNWSFDDLPDTIDGWVAWLQKARAETPAEYRDELNCVLTFEESYYDSGASASFNIWYVRPETDAEMTERVNRGLAYIREKAEGERQAYERLKAKFERT